MKPYIVFIVLLISSYFFAFENESTPLKKNEESLEIQIRVEGAVVTPGIYTISSGSMELLMEEVELTKDADCQCLDFSRELVHDDIVYIPSTSPSKVSLNQADKETLMRIKGIGDSKANKIIEYRQLRLFQSIEEVMNISGVGYKTYLKWREFLCL